MNVSVDDLAALLVEIDTDHWRRQAHREQARHLAAALHCPDPGGEPPLARVVEMLVRDAECHDLEEDAQRALQATLSVHGIPGGVAPTSWERALCELIVAIPPVHRPMLARAFPDWVAWAEVIDAPDLRARVLSAADRA